MIAWWWLVIVGVVCGGVGYVVGVHLALQSLTPVGSEIVNDPDFCVKYVREQRESAHQRSVKGVRDRRLADEAVGLLRNLHEPSLLDCSCQLTYEPCAVAAFLARYDKEAKS